MVVTWSGDGSEQTYLQGGSTTHGAGAHSAGRFLIVYLPVRFYRVLLVDRLLMLSRGLDS